MKVRSLNCSVGPCQAAGASWIRSGRPRLPHSFPHCCRRPRPHHCRCSGAVTAELRQGPLTLPVRSNSFSSFSISAYSRSAPGKVEGGSVRGHVFEKGREGRIQGAGSKGGTGAKRFPWTAQHFATPAHAHPRPQVRVQPDVQCQLRAVAQLAAWETISQEHTLPLVASRSMDRSASPSVPALVVCGDGRRRRSADRGKIGLLARSKGEATRPSRGLAQAVRGPTMVSREMKSSRQKRKDESKSESAGAAGTRFRRSPDFFCG